MKSLARLILLFSVAIVELNQSSWLLAKPNVVIFYLDDMGWGEPNCYGGKLAPTPNMDAIAANGVRFSQGYSSGCICTPGRVGLMTGRYQARTGQDANATGPGRELLLSERTIAEYMKPLGYTTGIIGKWHLGMTKPEYMPASRGFDFSVGTVGNLGEGKGPAFYRGLEMLGDLDNQPVTSPTYAKEACKFLDTNKSQPFFLYLSFNAVHSPLVASPSWLKKFEHLGPRLGPYAALIAEADEAIGTVMAKLREQMLEENTLIFCISDNGGANESAEQLGCRGRKWTVWEGGVRVTWMAQWKGQISPGRVESTPVIQLDVLPTILAAANASPPTDIELDGVNLLPLLQGKSEGLEREALYFRFGVQYAVRQGDWKLVKASLAMEPMLVNLANDIGEQHDLSKQHPDKRVELEKLWNAWNSKMQAPRWEDKRWIDGNAKSDRSEKQTKAKSDSKKKKRDKNAPKS